LGVWHPLGWMGAGAAPPRSSGRHARPAAAAAAVCAVRAAAASLAGQRPPAVPGAAEAAAAACAPARILASSLRVGAFLRFLSTQNAVSKAPRSRAPCLLAPILRESRGGRLHQHRSDTGSPRRAVSQCKNAASGHPAPCASFAAREAGEGPYLGDARPREAGVGTSRLPVGEPAPAAAMFKLVYPKWDPGETEADPRAGAPGGGDAAGVRHRALGAGGAPSCATGRRRDTRADRQHRRRRAPDGHARSASGPAVCGSSCASKASWRPPTYPARRRRRRLPPAVKLHDWFNLVVIALLNVLNISFLATGQG
jgi:hypothetical protein